MRSPRLKLKDRSAVYHCGSRIVGARYLLGEVEKAQFRRTMRLLADFCGVVIITHAILDNHFHLLVRVPAPEPISDEELARRVRLLYKETHPDVLAIAQDLKQLGYISGPLRERYLKRMGDISMYLKEVKQRFTRWYNRHHQSFGTIWAERFSSVLTEDRVGAVLAMAVYDDANAPRAGIVRDAKDYPFCGYAEALAVGGPALAGLMPYLEGATPQEKLQSYRERIFSKCADRGHRNKASLTDEEIRAQIKKGVQFPLKVLMQIRIGYFTRGAVLGSRAFVDEMFQRFRPHFGKNRKTGALAMKGADWGDLTVLRAQKNVFGTSSAAPPPP
jgi:putative transposase